MTMKALILLVATAAAASDEPAAVLLTGAEVEAAFRSLPIKPPTNREVIVQEHHTVKVARVENRNGPFELHEAQDRVLHILTGKAIMRVGGTLVNPQRLSEGEYRATSGTGYRELTLEPGAVLSIPRKVAYQIVAEGSSVSFLVVTVR